MMSEQNTRLRCRMSWLALLTIMALCLQSSYVDARLRSGNNNQSSKEQLADGPEIERQLRKKEKKVKPMSQAAITIREDANELTPFPEGKVPRNGVEIEIDLDNLNTIEDDNKNDNKKGGKSKKDSKQVTEPLEDENKIVGGYNAPQAYRYFAMLLDINSRGTYWSGCGGTLVSPDFILTAAHCVYDRLDKVDIAYINAYSPWLGNIGPNNNRLFSEIRRVTDIYIHADYEDSLSPPYDFALLKLDQPVHPYFEPIGLPSLSAYQKLGANNEFKIIGFGYTVFPSQGQTISPPRILQQTDVTFVPDQVCRGAFSNVNGGSLNFDSSMMCAKGPNYKADACRGDSGGPLIQTDPVTGKDILMGVTSWGVGCAVEGYPGVYGRVTSALPWIYESICEHTQDSASKNTFCQTLAVTASPTVSPTVEPETPAITDVPSLAPSVSVAPTTVPTETQETSMPSPSPTGDSVPTMLPSMAPSLNCEDVNEEFLLEVDTRTSYRKCTWRDTRDYCDYTVEYNGAQVSIEELCPETCGRPPCNTTRKR